MRVAVTGLGVVSSIGLNPGSYWKNLLQGGSGVKPVSLFDTSGYRCKLAGEITDFDPTQFVNPKSVKKYDRIQLLNTAAADLAWKSAGLDRDPYQADELGVVLGSTYGYVDSVSSFYLESLREGPRYVSPIHFANTVMNAPAGKIAIQHHITGLCSTIASGETSGIDALSYACDFIKSGKCKALLVGAGSALCEGLFLGFYQTGKLSGSREGETQLCTPFDRKGNGIILGEGAALVVLESMAGAKKRGAAVLAEVKGFGSHFLANTGKGEREAVRSAVLAMKAALEESGLTPGDISLVSASANSQRYNDRVEAMAIKEVFGEDNPDVVITAIKSMLGECLDASTAFQTAAAVCSLAGNRVPPIPNLAEPLVHDLNYARPGSPGGKRIDNVLVNGFSCKGKRASMVLAK